MGFESDYPIHGIDDEGAIAIGSKVVEMADRLKVVSAVVPGAQVTWAFELDGTRFKVTVRVDPMEDSADV